MLNLNFFKKKPKQKPLTKAERRERMLQKLRVSKPGWSDAQLLHYAATCSQAGATDNRRAQLDREAEILKQEGDVLLARAEANAASTRALLERPPLERPISVNGHMLTVTAFKQMQGDLATRFIGTGAEQDRERLAEANAIAVKNGLPEVYKQ